MKNRTAFGGFTILVVASALTLTLAGCSGNEGAQGTPGPGVTSPGAATALNITVTSATVSSAPVMKFTVTNQDGSKVAGLTLSDLRFAVAKLVPGSNGGPSKWQSYINSSTSGLTGYVRGNRENNGTLVDHQDGTYTYTFSTDITDPTKTCIAPCVDAEGNALDTSYNASLTHRVAVQTRGALPMVNGVYTFRPSDGATTGLFSREIVKTSKCNECHNKLELHDARIETQYCVMCHNPGSTGKGTVGTVTGPTTVDFKVMIHKIHNAPDLASVNVTGGDYGIFGYSGTLLSFKDVHFPQDIRNCTKCHDGAQTAQGDNWKNQPSKAACSACHDAVYFGTSPDPAKAYETVSHIAQAAAHVPPVTVGPDPSDDTCVACHSASGPAGSIEAAHEIPGKAAQARFKFNIISVTGGTTPVIKISVTDPTNNNAPYDIASGDATSNPIFKTPSRSRLALDIAWFSGSKDISNVGSGTDVTGLESPAENTDPGKPLGVDPVNACDGTPVTDWSCTVDGSFVYTLTKLSALPAAATGTGRVAFEGHPAGQDSAGGWTVNVVVKSEYKDFAITGSTVTARRQVVDIDKCNQCHEKLTLHGSNRTSEPQVCVVCHNPNLTDITHTGTFGSSNPPYLVGQRGRPKDAVTFLPLPSPLDGKKEEAADFKIMIHAIHAAARTAYPIPPATTGTPAHGFREKGIQVRSNDFSHIRFPGILNDCLTCHRPGTYELTGTWANPTMNGILSTTVNSVPLATDLTTLRAALLNDADNYRVSPTAAVCSSCHDDNLAKVHMKSTGGAVFGDDNKTQSLITSTVVETCVVCHGPGKVADVRVVHGVP